MTKETGGAAFPRAYDAHSWPGKDEPQGMTLRDYFAGQALAGMCASLTSEDQEAINGVDIVVHAYKFADAMLAARKDSDENK